jgi:acylpyruvate hydrolase
MTAQLRIATIAGATKDRVALVLEDGLVLLDEAVPDAPTDVRSLIAEWPQWSSDIFAAAARSDRTLSFEEVHWRPPVVPGKLLCVGTNYRDHVAEMTGLSEDDIPSQPFPFSFIKPSTSLAGSGDAIARPSYGRSLDWEAELGVVIGDGAAAAGPDPLAAVFGYTIVNELSLRDFYPFPHFLGLDAVVSKGFDGAAPIGPWITLAADVPDPQVLEIRLEVNGEVMQDSSTRKMIFDVCELLAHYGRVLTLEPGDVIATGTPAGVGAGHKPPRFLKAGDNVEVRIGDLGTLRNTISAPSRDDMLLKEEVPAAG